MSNCITLTASNMSELTSEAFMYCLFNKGEDTTNHVKVRGLNNIMFGLHPQRLEEKRELVTALLAELPEKFKEGLPFDNLCFTKNDELWTDSYQVCEQLVVMAIGLELMEYLPSSRLCLISPHDYFPVPYLKFV